MAGENARDNTILRQLAICGTLLVIGYAGLFCLLQSPALWYDLRPDPVRSLFPDLFRPINELFPDRWVNLDRTHLFALVMVPLYVAVLALITGPLLYLLRRLPRSGVLVHGHRKAALRTIVGFTLAIMFVLLFVRGLLSSDIYNYSWYARIWTEYGASPLTHTPSEFPPDPEGSIHWIGWPEETSVYGPAWLMVSSGAYKASQLIGGSFSAQLLSLRLLADGAHLLNAWLVWSIAGLLLARRKPRPDPTPRTRWRPRPIHSRTFRLRTRWPRIAGTAKEGESNRLGLQFAALLFYTWNPLMLVEFAASGHNDVVMLTFVLLAVWLHLKGWWRLAALALGVAALVKLPAIIFVPGYLWLLWEGAIPARGKSAVRGLAAGAWRVAQALALILAAWVVLYLPFWEGPRTLQALVSGPANRLYLHTLAADIWMNAPQLLANVLGVTDGREQFMESVRRFLDANLRLGFMGLFGVVAVAVTWRARTFSRMLTAWGWVAIAAIMAQGWVWPWYVSWAIAPAALAPSRRLRNATLVFTVSALLLYIEEQILGSHFRLFLDWSGVLIMAPPLVYILCSWLLEVRRNRGASSLPTGTSTAKQRRAKALGQPGPVH
ncbi:MAG TPA: hypothetical protein VEX13_11830 [Chloroflexia bacterium]|nr:hypothetical protein [Chloroflexia bacterium]